MIHPPFYCPRTRRLSQTLPPPSLALEEPNGLLAIGGDLAPATLLAAYRQGVFPWYSSGQPLLWWSPDPRTVIRPAEFHVSRSLRRSLRRLPWRIVVDGDFEGVVCACAEPRSTDAGTWLTPEMIDAYCALHRLGHAHSVECRLDGRLVGGVYGIAVGTVFCGESMFSRVPDASKVALHALCQRLHRSGFTLLDCQVENPHLVSLGAEPMPRQAFCEILNASDNGTGISADAWSGAYEGDDPA